MSTDYADQPTDAERITSRIRREVGTIRRGWDDMLPTGAPAQQYRVGRGRAPGIVGDNTPPVHELGREYWRSDISPDIRAVDRHFAGDSDIDPLTRIVSLRTHITTMLNGWCRVVMEERPITSSKALPLGDDVPGMCTFLDRHADWIAGQEFALDCADEIADYAKAVTGIVDPWRKERHFLGWCCFVHGENLTIHDSNAVSCRGRVSLPIGGDQDEASCSECETKGPLRWWEEVLGLSRFETATIPQLTRIIADRLHIEVTPQTVRRWVNQGAIQPWPLIGPQPMHRTFEVRAVLDEIARWGGRCVMCGSKWEGVGDTCTRCYVARSNAVAVRSEPRPIIAVGTVSPEATLDVCAIDERQRCEWSDLPTRWCACRLCTSTTKIG